MAGFTIDPLGMWKTAVENANVVGMKIKAAKSDKSESVKALIDSSDDAQIVKFREGRAALQEQIETLQAKITNGEAKIRDYAETLLPGVEADFNLEEETKKFVTLRKIAHDAESALKAFGVTDEQMAEARKELGIVEVINLRGTGTRKGGSTGNVRRPRIATATVNGEAVFSDKEKTKVDFTGLAKFLKTDAETLKAEAFKAAETEDLNSLPGGTEVSWTHGEDKKVVVTVSDKKPGRPAAEKPESPAAETEKVAE